MSDKKPLYIDVREIISSKNQKLGRRIPRCVIRYLEKILHQDEINEFLKTCPGLEGMDFVRKTISFMQLGVEYAGFENIPKEGRFVFASNHPLVGLESVVLMDIVSKKFDNFVFVVNDLLMALKPMNMLFVPVNKVGGQTRESVAKVNAAYKSDKQILFFPAGLVSRKIKGKVIDTTWQKSFVSKAVETKRDIVPVYIEGRNSNFFYRLAKLRKFFRIKTNIEMLYLVNETFKQKGKTIKIVFGEPVPYAFFDKSKTFLQWADYLKKKVYSLK
ncbi:MAG: 1-acyl-sn-glycerol-3-phosphate acyltransferase [Bacteroidales bacterium]|nr:1-acyl-sn-glycerol-3-phosphate acyltransferase [Bacteroidales bacterium]